MKKLICTLVVMMITMTIMVGVLLAAGGKKASPAKTQIADIDQMLEAAKSAIATRSGETIKWQVISAGGTAASSENYTVNGTAGETAIGAASSENYDVSNGYWMLTNSSSGGCCVGIRGNVNFDGGDNIDISDLVYLVNYMFTGGPPPACWEEADINGSGGIDISDLVYLVNYMFTGGPPPMACP